MKKIVVKKEVLGIYLSDATLDEVSEYVLNSVENDKEKLSIITPNPEMVVYASAHPSFKKLINEADIAVCDGVGLYFAAQLLGNSLKERITGVDLMQQLCERSTDLGLSIGLLGGRAGVAERTAECLREKHPGLKVVFIAEEWGEKGFADDVIIDYRLENIENKARNQKSEIKNPSIDLLFVAYGVPKQEEWIAKNLPLLPIKVAMGVGGAFDFLSGNVMRAPFWVRSIGLEWAFRLIRQPWRIKRQLKLLTFLWLVIREKTSLK